MSDSPTVRMNLTSINAFSPVEGATWTSYKENGTVLGQASGDVTTLLEDTLAYAYENGFPFHATGRTFRGTNSAIGIDPNHPTLSIARGTPMYMCLYRTVKLPPMICHSAIFDNVGILSRPIDGGWGLEFDSFEDLTFEQRGGQFLYRGDAGAIRFNPTNPVPGDEAITMNTGKIKFQAVTLQEKLNAGSHPSVVKFELSACSMFLNDISFGEVDGTNLADHAIYVLQDLYNPNGFIFQANKISALTAYRTLAAAVQIGNGPVNQNNIRYNEWDFRCVQPGNYADGINTFGSNDTFNVGAIGSVSVNKDMFRGLVFNPDTNNNKYHVGAFIPPFSQDVINAGGAGNTSF